MTAAFGSLRLARQEILNELRLGLDLALQAEQPLVLLWTADDSCRFFRLYCPVLE